MKKYLSFMLLAAALQLPASAITVDGISYSTTSSNKTATVTGYDSNVITDGVIDIPESITNNSTIYTVTVVKGSSFKGSDIVKVTIPATVISIQTEAFANCKSLKEVIIADGTSNLNCNDPFASAAVENLYIGRNTYYSLNCDFPNTVTHLTLGPKVTKLNQNFFTQTGSNIQSVVSLNTNPPTLDDTCLDKVDKKNVPLYVPEGTVDQYKKATVWKEFFNITDEEYNGGAGDNNLNDVLIHVSVKPNILLSLSAMLDPEDAEANVVWESSNPQIFSVDANGMGKSLKQGRAVVTATANGLSHRVGFIVDPTTTHLGSVDAETSASVSVANGAINVTADNAAVVTIVRPDGVVAATSAILAGETFSFKPGYASAFIVNVGGYAEKVYVN